MHEIKVDFRIIGFDCFADEITGQIDLQPSKILSKGDFIRGDQSRKRKDNIWILESESENQEALEAHLEQLASKMIPHISKLKKVCERYYSEFACRLYLKKDAEQSIPSFHLSKSFINLMKEIGAELDLDIYKI